MRSGVGGTTHKDLEPSKPPMRGRHFRECQINGRMIIEDALPQKMNIPDLFIIFFVISNS